MIDFSQHAKVRTAQRNLTKKEIGYVLVYGQKFHKAGALIYFLRNRDIPDWDRSDPELMRLVGTAVLLTKDGRLVVTVWRNRSNGLKHIKRKPDFDNPREAFAF